ncbi:MAG: hypothetical protein WBE76_09885 [Terracidiphilus sp.]
MRIDLTRTIGILTSSFIIFVAACTGLSAAAATKFTIGGNVSGLDSKESVTLLLNRGDPTKVSKDGNFKFSTALASGTAYSVTVSVQPAGQICTVKNGTGKVKLTDITHVEVNCAKAYTIGGAVSGLVGKESVTLLDNKGNPLRVIRNGNFTFTALVPGGDSYDVTVGVQPVSAVCTVAGGTGKVKAADIKSVKVTCAQLYSIGGAVTGLGSKESVTLLDNHANPLTVKANGSFKFSKELPSKATYDVTVAAQPAGESCVVNKGAGKVGTANVTDIAVACHATVVATYSIGGMVTGLSANTSVVLVDNNTNPATVSVDGGFTFSTKLASGAGYDVSVKTQPTGETCTVANASGTVKSANVTNVAVTCSPNTTGGGGSGIWLPFSASPVSGTTGGQTGLFVIPSGNIADSTPPTPQWVSTAAVQLLALDVQLSFSGNSIAEYQPYLLAYAAADSGGTTHIYGLNLTNASSAPVAAQISNLSVPSTQEICSANGFSNNISDATTAFLVLDVGPVNACGTGDTFEVVHYGDSSTTAPTIVNLSTTSLDEIYNNGTLAGLVEFDFASGNVNLYADDSFTNPKTLFTKATDASSVGSGTSKFTGDGSIFYTVTTSSGSTLYLIDSAGDTTSVFTGTIDEHTADDNNLYFVSSPPGPPVTTDIYQVSLGGGTPQKLFDVVANSPNTTPTIDLVGSNDSVLIFAVPSGSGATQSTTLSSIPVGTTSSTSTAIGTYSGSVGAFLGVPASGGVADAVLFLNDETATTSSNVTKYSWSSVAWPAAGPYTATPLAGSAYADLGVLSADFGGVTWRVEGITDTSGGVGGGIVYQTDIGTLAETAVTTSGGGKYTTQNGYEGLVEGISTSGIAVGEYRYVAASGTTNATFGVAADTTKNFLLPIKLTNTDVEPLF